MPEKYPEENIQYSNHGESLKSRTVTRITKGTKMMCRVEETNSRFQYNFIVTKLRKNKTRKSYYFHTKINYFARLICGNVSTKAAVT